MGRRKWKKKRNSHSCNNKNPPPSNTSRHYKVSGEPPQAEGRSIILGSQPVLQQLCSKTSASSAWKTTHPSLNALLPPSLSLFSLFIVPPTLSLCTDWLFSISPPPSLPCVPPSLPPPSLPRYREYPSLLLCIGLSLYPPVFDVLELTLCLFFFFTELRAAQRTQRPIKPRRKPNHKKKLQTKLTDFFFPGFPTQTCPSGLQHSAHARSHQLRNMNKK